MRMPAQPELPTQDASVTETGASAPTPPADAPVTAGVAAGGGRPVRQYGLDALRVLAVCGVVAVHVIGLVLGHDDLRHTLAWWTAAAIDLGATWTVPVFVMISGALTLAPRAHAAGPVAFYRKRFVRIVPALVVWHLVYLVGVRMLWRGEELTLTLLARNLMDARVFTALYFLWLIAGLYLVAPVLAAFLKDGGRRRAMILAGVALAFTLVTFAVSGMATMIGAPRPIHLGALTMWWPYVGYFLAGWALHRVVLGRRGLLLAGVLAVLLMAEAVWQWGVSPEHRWLQTLLPVGYLGGTVAVAAICLFLLAVGIGARVTPSERSGRLLVRLSDASFGVFLVHLLVLELLRQTVPEVAEGRSLPLMLGAYLVILVVSFAASLGAARVPYLRAIV
ncbi:acyltransferase family protein [Plantactinospora veratri]|uniref:Acyltransferase family protein n=1 Tax=Plantactinospora veratri TaxID=1436122 RepID=A0ABU7SP26_9ACTN